MFKKILNEQWNSLSPMVQKHYGLNQGESFNLKGQLAVKHGRFIKLLMPFIRLTGALVPVEGDNFEVTVENKRIDDCYYWHREFKKNGKCYIFDSTMQPFGQDIVEFVGLGIGIRMGLKAVNGAMVFIDKGYVIKIGSKLFPIPLHWFIGKSTIEEHGSCQLYTDNNEKNDINMKFIVTHPWFGFAFSYQGYLNIDK